MGDGFNLDMDHEAKKSKGAIIRCMECGETHFQVITNVYPFFILRCVDCRTQFDMKPSVDPYKIRIKASRKKKPIKTVED